MKAASATADPEISTQKQKQADRRKKPQRQPRYNVVLWDDDDHTYDYVIRMLKELFAHPTEKAYEMARKVDANGKVICLTTTLEHAELKRDQIHAYGKDQLIAKCQGSMSSTIQPVA